MTERMKVLVVSYHAPPVLNAESILVWKTIRALSRDFQVQLLTSSVDGSRRLDDDMALPTQVEVIRRNVFHLRNPFLAKVVSRGMGLAVDEAFLFARKTRKTFLDKLSGDVIYSRSHPGASHILAYRIKRQTGKPWIAQFSDPWSANPYHEGHTHFRKRFDRRWERRVIEHADSLVFPTKEILAMYVDAYPHVCVAEKAFVIPHHYTPELYRPRAATTAPTDTDVVTFGYFGDFYGARSPKPLIDAVCEVQRKRPEWTGRIRIRLVGSLAPKYQAEVDRREVRIDQSKASYFDSLIEMSETDVLVLIDAPSKSGVNPFLASKLMDYLGAGRPILGITDSLGTAAEILRGCGHTVVSPYETSRIASAVEKLILERPVVSAPAAYATESVVGELARVLRNRGESSRLNES
ncbi:glycosyltransferase [Alicyclobacillus fastidiosus]|uniref:glycosyltransferase n=1 Tax=Alicyclobacillus fastidiosus TaxID=392011 RepID=UPI0023E9133F|nr:glycosyltransferase [Alicyclobacillus fastidiosus]GMA61582.1 hypothetical protein GCM10025859_20220 [Alicyclobacillus fastidiosus]